MMRRTDMTDQPQNNQIPGLPPNRVPVQPGEPSKKKTYDLLGNIPFVRLLAVILLVFVCIVAWVIIRDLSGMGSHFGSVVMDWLHGAGLNPDNRHAFKNFLSLVLTLFSIAGALYFLNKRK